MIIQNINNGNKENNNSYHSNDDNDDDRYRNYGIGINSYSYLIQKGIRTRIRTCSFYNLTCISRDCRV